MKNAEMTKHYVACRDGDIIVLSASDPDAKQALWGWAGDYGSTKDPGAIELYGTENHEQPWQGDHTPWVWKLSADGVASIRKSFKLGLDEAERFETSKKDARLYREVLALLDRLHA